MDIGLCIHSRKITGTYAMHMPNQTTYKVKKKPTAALALGTYRIGLATKKRQKSKSSSERQCLKV